MNADQAPDWDYVIVGSGAGGGVLAARLVEEGMRVFLIEAGGDPRKGERMPDDYDVPAFHAFACENDALKWDFFVRHYDDEERQKRDPKYTPDKGGVLYPRAAALGGCTVHNAMIFMPPHDSDWDEIARSTSDVSWNASHMRRYAQRIENCRHRPVWRLLRHVGFDPTGHGWNGWLRTEKSMPLSVLHDNGLIRTVVSTVGTFTHKLPTPLRSAWNWIRGGVGDPNSRRFTPGSFEGICYTPLATSGHRRFGVRERLIDVKRRFPDRLHIELDALATRVLFDARGAANGVEFLKGAHLYRAHAKPNAGQGDRREVRAQREVILCGGAFNTPQLLMLSGIGCALDLRQLRIEPRVDLPAVGRNLQDRYEVALTHRMKAPWEVLEGAQWKRGDPLWDIWKKSRTGMYGSNGAAVGLVTRSDRATTEPDIFCMALLARFEGYFPGFSRLISAHSDQMTWAILKGHTRNRAGSVRLRSADPLDPPLISFRYFEESGEGARDDLQAIVQAIREIRALTAPLVASGWIREEVLPGAGVDSDEAVAQYVRDTAWGHHASCSCPIGDRDKGGVLDSTLSVHGVSRLRVVDASAFPKIPGFFVAAAVYMLAEKAADMVLSTATQTPLSTN
ncbi:GMC family oxidoreductase [Variovorax sp. J22R133]|uniref:GMC family oxidoreductase n=1 Tax=Variovorax brevis TaxID=3053503 RepID=UPI0025757EFD|nr:GMC family oxidoreductase [Variovorax sp. J22R133]MDM0110972.1 GMC family oxidoreductase [Variovorax sp. J22R133]